MAPRKVRMAADLVRGKKVVEAQRLLQFAAKHSAHPVLKTLNSAIASARNNFQADESNLYISHISVNEGPKLKRYRPRARGQAYEIQKKTSHVTIVIDEIEQQKTKTKKKIVQKRPGTKQDLEKPEEKQEEQEEKSMTPGRSATPRKGSLGARARERQAVVSRPKEQQGVKRFFRRKAV